MNQITIGSEMFSDITPYVQPDRAPRVRSVALVIHHSVTAQIPLTRATSEAEKVAIVQAIDAYHVQQDYGGFGYNAICFGDGTVWVVGDGSGQRAHVAYRNHELEGLVLVGDYSTAPVPLGAVLGAARWVRAKWQQHGALPVLGHRQAAVAASPSACPGDAGMRALQTITDAARAIEAGERQRVEQMARDAIRAALQPAIDRLDLKTLHGQLHYLGAG